MLDFLILNIKTTAREKQLTVSFDLSPDVKDIMVQGGAFYAAWDEFEGRWTKNKERVYVLIDKSIQEYIDEIKASPGGENLLNGCHIPKATNSDSGIADKFKRYVKDQKMQRFIPLDTKVVFKNDPRDRDMYSSHRLPYDPKNEPTPAYDRLVSVLYAPSEIQKLEWLVGAGLCGDNGVIQKFGVLYGEPGSGKGTMLEIVKLIFSGYTSAFEADALGRASDQFSLEPFKNHPVVAIQTDGNLSHIENNAKLNTLVSHEPLTVNEKFKGRYDTKFDTILLIGTNSPVKITDSKSGLLRRLIDIEPTGEKIPMDEYLGLMHQVKFEIPGIAYKCMKLYSKNKGLYNSYSPVSMMEKTNDFYDFMLEYYDQFCESEWLSLLTAWNWYKKYCEDAGANKLPRRIFATELSYYYAQPPHDEYHEDENGLKKHYTSVFRDFRKEKFKKRETVRVKLVRDDGSTTKETDIYSGLPTWLHLEDVTDYSSEAIANNALNVYLKNAKAQYAVPNVTGTGSRPKKAWSSSNTTLGVIDTTTEHYVLTQSVDEALIVIDFDKKDPKTGKKSLRLNLEAAQKFMPTYAETSKSGEGLHLHYIYDGDPDELSYIFDDSIEIKVFKGKSALRRKLKLCNEEKIAHISSGLPLKEKGRTKVIDMHVIENEKHLRSLIKKGLRREVFQNTKPSMDYIKKIMEEAYDGDIPYDVSDMRNAIMNFAAGSTNNSDYCMELALALPYMSRDREELLDSEKSEEEQRKLKVYSEKPIVFFDWEVFPNLSILCYKVEGGTVGEEGKSEVVKLINPTPNDVSQFVNDYRIIGFNNLGYDNHITYARMLGKSNYELYMLSQRIIKNEKDAGFREAKNISYTDIFDFANTKQGLKKWEIELGIHHQEFPLRWDQDVPEDKWELAADYCANDVVATEVLFYHLKEDWEARQVLAKLSGLTVNDKTNTHTCRILFGKNKHPQDQFNYPDLSKEFPGYEFSSFGIDKERYNTGADGKSVMTSGKSIFMGDDPSEGGYVYFETGIHRNVALLDIASLHPTTIEVVELFGPEYTARFSEIKSARVAIKHKDWDKVKVYLDGALVPFLDKLDRMNADEEQAFSDSLSYAFKIVINSIYGLTSAKFENPCRDPRNVDNVVAKRGALFMILLKHKVQEKGYRVAHVKTDSIKIPDATQEIIDFVMDFGKKYGYTFEHEATYEKMCLFNKSVYVAKYDEFGERTKGGRHAGQWTATGAECQHPYIFKTLFSHEPIEFKDYCETKSVSGGAAIYLDKNESLVTDLEEEVYSLRETLANATSGKLDIRRNIKAKQEEIDSIHDYMFVGKCGLFVPVEKGCDGGYMYRIEDGKNPEAISGTKGYRWLEVEEVHALGIEDRLDKVYFRSLIDSTYDHIGKFGDADEFING